MLGHSGCPAGDGKPWPWNIGGLLTSVPGRPGDFIIGPWGWPWGACRGGGPYGECCGCWYSSGPVPFRSLGGGRLCVLPPLLASDPLLSRSFLEGGRDPARDPAREPGFDPGPAQGSVLAGREYVTGGGLRSREGERSWGRGGPRLGGLPPFGDSAPSDPAFWWRWRVSASFSLCSSLLAWRNCRSPACTPPSSFSCSLDDFPGGSRSGVGGSSCMGESG